MTAEWKQQIAEIRVAWVVMMRVIAIDNQIEESQAVNKKIDSRAAVRPLI